MVVVVAALDDSPLPSFEDEPIEQTRAEFSILDILLELKIATFGGKTSPQIKAL